MGEKKVDSEAVKRAMNDLLHGYKGSAGPEAQRLAERLRKEMESRKESTNEHKERE